MTRRRIPANELFDRWDKDPEFRKEYDALEGEFALARLFIETRARADLTQEQVAERMGTTQAVIARLESGRVKPSTRTLERFAGDGDSAADRVRAGGGEDVTGALVPDAGQHLFVPAMVPAPNRSRTFQVA